MPIWYWLPGLLGRSPSYYVDPWASRTYDPKFCIFCMPEPDSDSPYVHYFFFFVPAQSAVLSLCESSLAVWALRVVWGLSTVPQPLLSTHCL